MAIDLIKSKTLPLNNRGIKTLINILQGEDLNYTNLETLDVGTTKYFVSIYIKHEGNIVHYEVKDLGNFSSGVYYLDDILFRDILYPVSIDEDGKPYIDEGDRYLSDNLTIFIDDDNKVDRKYPKLILKVLIVVVGLLILSYPKFKEVRSTKTTETLLNTYKEQIEAVEEDYKPIDKVEGEGKIIKADKIDLEMPIVHGATFENMKDSVATIKHKELTEGQNYSIAGHRYITHGRHFNRIDELEEGDKLEIINDKGQLLEYKVYDKLVVEPEDISVLDDTGKTEVTLITCHPPGISSHRLVVKAVREGD